MSVADQTPVAGYTGNGVATAFSFPFAVLAEGDVSVMVAGLLLTLNVHYTVSGVGGASGTVTFTSAPASLASIVIYRDSDLTRDTDYQDNGDLLAATLNRDLDRLWLALQEVLAGSKVSPRSVRAPIGETLVDLPAASVRAGNLLGFDGVTGQPIAVAPNSQDASALALDLASTAAGKGAALVGAQDAGGYFSGANAEQIFAEIGNPFGAYSNGIHIFRYIPPAQWAGIFDGTNATDNTPHLVSAVTAARLSSTDTTGRTRSASVYIPAGVYNISTAAALAPVNGCSGMTIYGSGRGSTVLQFTAAGSTISVASSIYTTFRDITFRSSVGIDTDQAAFTIAQTGNPLRSWRFERCAFEALYRCFAVTGASMCSEFSFEQCGFAQCYTLMHNSNDQAVNWTFSDCHWENGSMITSKDKNLASAFHLTKGTFVDWRGGSMIFIGKLVYFDLTASGVFSRTSHKLHFEGLRVELEDDGAGAHTPWIDRVSSGYVSGSNSPAVTFENATVLNRGAIATSTVYAKLWANCKFTFRDLETEGGVVSGILDSVTAASAATLILDRARGLAYAEDTAARVNSHDQHYVEIIPDATSAATTPRVSMRLGSLSVPSCAETKTLYVRGPTGSIPQGGTTVNLPLLPDHTSVLRIFLSRYAAALQTLQVDLKDQADTTVYATFTALAADRFKEDTANAKEIGVQIPSGTPLMLKFTGTPEVVKGVVGVEYL